MNAHVAKFGSFLSLAVAALCLGTPKAEAQTCTTNSCSAFAAPSAHVNNWPSGTASVRIGWYTRQGVPTLAFCQNNSITDALNANAANARIPVSSTGGLLKSVSFCATSGQNLAVMISSNFTCGLFQLKPLTGNGFGMKFSMLGGGDTLGTRSASVIACGQDGADSLTHSSTGPSTYRGGASDDFLTGSASAYSEFYGDTGNDNLTSNSSAFVDFCVGGENAGDADVCSCDNEWECEF